jgi:hypothetical protein
LWCLLLIHCQSWPRLSALRLATENRVWVDQARMCFCRNISQSKSRSVTETMEPSDHWRMINREYYNSERTNYSSEANFSSIVR